MIDKIVYWVMFLAFLYGAILRECHIFKGKIKVDSRQEKLLRLGAWVAAAGTFVMALTL